MGILYDFDMRNSQDFIISLIKNKDHSVLNYDILINHVNNFTIQNGVGKPLIQTLLLHDFFDSNTMSFQEAMDVQILRLQVILKLIHLGEDLTFLMLSQTNGPISFWSALSSSVINLELKTSGGLSCNPNIQRCFSLPTYSHDNSISIDSPVSPASAQMHEYYISHRSQVILDRIEKIEKGYMENNINTIQNIQNTLIKIAVKELIDHYLVLSELSALNLGVLYQNMHDALTTNTDYLAEWNIDPIEDNHFSIVTDFIDPLCEMAATCMMLCAAIYFEMYILYAQSHHDC